MSEPDLLSYCFRFFIKVASLDDRGTVSIWVVTEAKKIDEGGSQVRHHITHVKPPSHERGER